MKQIFFLMVIILLTGCVGSVVYKPAPRQVIAWEEAVKLNGSVTPWGLDFMAVSLSQNDQTRLVVLSSLGIKLLDVAVSDNEAEIYFKQEKFPKVALQAFIRFARSQLRSNCPDQTIVYYDKRTRAHFQAQAKGAVSCL